jgi:hypothetical protein
MEIAASLLESHSRTQKKSAAASVCKKVVLLIAHCVPVNSNVVFVKCLQAKFASNNVFDTQNYFFSFYNITF